MNYEINGLPLHILLVHATVVFVPLAAFLVLVGIFAPKFRRQLSSAIPIVALLALALTPITQQAGNWLLERINATPEVMAHANLGSTLLPWTFGVFVGAVGEWIWVRKASHIQAAGEEPGRNPHRPHSFLQWTIWVLAAVAITFVCLQTMLLVAQVGESGSRAVWEGVYRSN